MLSNHVKGLFYHDQYCGVIRICCLLSLCGICGWPLQDFATWAITNPKVVRFVIGFSGSQMYPCQASGKFYCLRTHLALYYFIYFTIASCQSLTTCRLLKHYSYAFAVKVNIYKVTYMMNQIMFFLYMCKKINTKYNLHTKSKVYSCLSISEIDKKVRCI